MNLKRIAAAILAFGALLTGAEPEQRPSSLTVGTKVGQRLPHFKAEVLDLSGESVVKAKLDSHADKKATAYVFMSRTCPYCIQYQKRLAEMAEAYASKGLRFVMVYPTRRTPESRKIEYHRSAGFKAPFLNDKDASIAKILNIRKTPEVVLASKKGEIVFRGGIDDNPRDVTRVKKPHLKNAADSLLAGRKVEVTTAPLYG